MFRAVFVASLIAIVCFPVFAFARSYPPVGEASAAPATTAPATAASPEQSSGPQTPSTLEGTHWKLVELGGAPPAKSADAPEPYLQFDGATKHIAALGGCNRLMGAYTVQGATLSIAAGGMTMMMCPEPLDKQELAFTDALRATKSYRITGNTLELLDGQKVVARFAPAAK